MPRPLSLRRSFRWKPPLEGNHRLFSATVSGLAVFAPKLAVSIVCELPTGRLIFDDFEGRWGDPKELDRFKQRYAIEKASMELAVSVVPCSSNNWPMVPSS